MEANLSEIRSFLTTHPAFSFLSPDVLGSLLGKIQVTRAHKDAILVQPGQTIQSLYLIRSGVVDIKAPDGRILMQLGEGEAFGVRAMLGNGMAPNLITALEDVELYLLPKDEFAHLHDEHPRFAEFFVPIGGKDLPSGGVGLAQPTKDQVGLMSSQLKTLMTREPVTVERGSSIRIAAQRMRDHGISCVPVVEGESLVGILTNGDLRDRVIAEGLDVDSAVEHAMTPAPMTIEADRYALDALLAMTEKNISHLPVMDDNRLVGIITNTNLVRKQTLSAVYMVSDISKRDSDQELSEVVAQVPQLLADLVETGAAAYSIGQMITSICDAVTRRLLELAESKLGPPPVPYVWLACGSQARQEQTGVSDQDNCLVIDDAYKPKVHGDYFQALARYVCDGLDASGYIYCPGEMMAMTDKWRQPVRDWRKYFASWINEPEPMAQMLTSVLFDMRPVWGDGELHNTLQEFAVRKAQANSIFIAHLVGNALTHTPPLGFFRNFVLIRGGEHKHHFDMKHSGVVPIIDIARVYALKSGIMEVNTRKRLLAAQQAETLSESGARDLIEAFEFISVTRLKHQSRQIRSGQQPDNFMSPEDLSHFERGHLKEAFNIVKTIQASMASTHQIGVR